LSVTHYLIAFVAGLSPAIPACPPAYIQYLLTRSNRNPQLRELALNWSGGSYPRISSKGSTIASLLQILLVEFPFDFFSNIFNSACFNAILNCGLIKSFRKSSIGLLGKSHVP